MSKIKLKRIIVSSWKSIQNATGKLLAGKGGSELKDNWLWPIIILLLLLVCGYLLITRAPKWLVDQYTQFDFGTIKSEGATGAIGDTYGGTLAPIIGLIGIYVTFLAFWVQFRANQHQRRQFKAQGQDTIFYRLFDDLHSKIISTSLPNAGVAGYNNLSHLVSEFEKTRNEELVDLGRELIRDNHELANSIFFNFLHGGQGYNVESVAQEEKDFHEIMSSMSDRNERWEYLKFTVGGVGSEYRNARGALGGVASVNFYRIPFTQRYRFYKDAFHKFRGEYSDFLNSYFRSWEFIVAFIIDLKYPPLYVQYYQSRTSKADVLLIFYYMMSGLASDKFYEFYKRTDMLSDLLFNGGDLIDSPSPDQIRKELKEVYEIPSQTLMTIFNSRELKEDMPSPSKQTAI